MTGADRSLRTYIQKASSGRADLDAVVMPTQVADMQDVPPHFLDGQLGSQLRNQGYDAAAIVMLGGPGRVRREVSGRVLSHKKSVLIVVDGYHLVNPAYYDFHFVDKSSGTREVDHETVEYPSILSVSGRGKPRHRFL
jgi:hypothetical protein